MRVRQKTETVKTGLIDVILAEVSPAQAESQLRKK
jgi:hypothetical protein